MFVAAFTTLGYGQSVVITSKKVTYTRPKPIEDYKKTFTINYPKVKASTPTLSKKPRITASKHVFAFDDVAMFMPKLSYMFRSFLFRLLSAADGRQHCYLFFFLAPFDDFRRWRQSKCLSDGFNQIATGYDSIIIHIWHHRPGRVARHLPVGGKPIS